MRNDRLVRHFLQQFVENELSPDTDRHQILAIAAAALVTLPLFLSVFMSLKYLMRPMQAPGWTAVTAMGDQMIFCAISLLVTAIIATLEWDALSLSPRDGAILGVLPIPHRTVVRAKVAALVTFATGFVIALNALPVLLHPAFMTAQLAMSPFVLLPLMAAHGVAASLAGAFGFASVLAIREALWMVTGPDRFARLSSAVRSTLLFVLLLALTVVPARLFGANDWTSAPTPIALRPVSWFAAAHASLAGRLLDALPRPGMPARVAIEEQRFTSRYRAARHRFDILAIRGIAAVTGLSLMALALHLRNARRHSQPSDPARRSTRRRPARPIDLVAGILARNGPANAGVGFLLRTVCRSATHRIYATTAVVAAVTVVLAMGPVAFAGYRGLDAPVRTLTVAAQTLALCALAAGFRATLRTAADPRADWTFSVADTGTSRQFRSGVRAGGIALMVLVVAIMFPVYLAAWAMPLAIAHAVNGVALGLLIADVSFADVDRPLVVSIPPPDGLNTVGVVLLGAATIAVFAISKIEATVLPSTIGSALFAAAALAGAVTVRVLNDRAWMARRTALGPDGASAAPSGVTR